MILAGKKVITRAIAFILIFAALAIPSFGQSTTWYEKGKSATDLNQKVEFFTKSLQEEKKSNWTYYHRAWAYMELEKYQLAISDFQNATKADGTLEKVWIYNGLGWAYYDIEEYAKAKEYSQKAIAEDIKNYTAYDILGWTAIAENNPTEAAAQFGKYIQYNAGSHVGFNDRSYAWSLLGLYEKVLSDCNEGLLIEPGHEQMTIRKGLALIKLGKTNDGLAILQGKVVYQPDDPISLSNIGRLFYEAGDYKTAVEFHSKGITLYEEKIRIDPKYVKVYKEDVYSIYMDRGDAYEGLEQWQSALQNYTKATLIDPANVLAWIEMGEVHTFQTNYKEAVQAYEKAFTLQPEYADGWTNLGFCYDNLLLPDKAIEAYTRGIAANPSDGLLYNNRGYAYLEKGLMDKAKADLEKAVQVEPEIVMSHVSLGEYYFMNLQYDDAIKKFNEAVLMPSGSVSAYQVAYYTRGRCYHAHKDYAKAIADYQLSITYDKTHIESWEYLGIAHFETRENCKAYKEFKKAVELDAANRIKRAKESPKYLAKLTGNPCQ